MRAGELIDGRFLLLSRAGSGGMGTVWKAEDRETGVRVALKLLRDPERGSVPRFRHEARILSELEHAHVVRHVGHGISPEGEPYLAMEWLEGEDLSARLTRGRLTVDESVELVMRVADALAMAHARGIVHRDIKPSNLFLPNRDPRRVRLLDFGIARLMTPTSPLTSQSILLGTPGYVAPEQVRGEATVGPAADIFSLGCVFFECLAGRPAFQGAHPMALLAKLLLEDPPRLSELRHDISWSLSSLVERMLSKNPSARPRDGAALLASFTTLETTVPPSNTQGPRSGAPSRIGRGERRLMSIVALTPPRFDPMYAPTVPIEVAKNEMAEGAPSLPSPSSPAAPETVAQIAARLAAPHGGRIERLADGTILVILCDGNPAEQAVRACRISLAMHSAAPGAPTALVSGRSDYSDKLPVGELVDRAAGLLEKARRDVDPRPLLDEETCALVDARFELQARKEGDHALVREHWKGEEARTLLGKPSPFVGRERELANLSASLEEAFEEPSARAFLVTAPAGMGKSRLGQELLARLGQRFPDAAFAVGRADSLGTRAAFSVVASGLRSAMGIEAGEPVVHGPYKILECVRRFIAGDHATRVAEFVGELVDAPFPDEASPLLCAARRNAAVMAAEVQAAFIELMRAMAQRSPVVLVLEDLQWGDASSVKLVDAALRELREAPFAVIALARPEVHEVFPRLFAARGGEEIRLGPLPRKSAVALVRAALGDRVAPEQIAQILDRSEGNAFYLEELVRAAQEGRSGELPVTVLGTVEARLSALPPDARRLLRAASVFGEVFWTNGVLALFGKDRPATFEDTLRLVVEREIVTRRTSRRFAGEEELSFRHGLVRDAAYAMLTERDRVAGHGLAGAWLERVGEPDPAVVAMHYELGRRSAKAAILHAQAAQRAMRGYDLSAALDAVSRGLSNCPEGGQIAADLWALRARIESTAGNVDRALVAAEEAMRIARPGSNAYCLALEGAISSAMLLGRTDAVRAHVARLPGIEPDIDAVSALARVFAPTIVGQVALGQAHEARPLLERLRHIMAGRMENEHSGAAALIYASACWEHYIERRPWSALRLGREAIRRLSIGGEAHLSTAVGANLVAACAALGAFEDAAEYLEVAFSKARPGSLSMFTASCHLARLQLERGEVDLAHAGASALLAEWGERYEGVLVSYARLILVEASITRGEHEAAERSITALRGFGAVAPIAGPMASFGEAKLLLARRDARGAAAAAEAAIAACARLGIAPFESMRLAQAEALFGADLVVDARRAIEEARREVLARAEGIDDAQYKARFLERVTANARILALAREWLG